SDPRPRCVDSCSRSWTPARPTSGPRRTPSATIRRRPCSARRPSSKSSSRREPTHGRRPSGASDVVTAAARRVGATTSKKRDELLDAVERLMVREGYAAVTYRAVAAKAGVTAGLVQYYFPTLDDLFTAAIRRRSG